MIYLIILTILIVGAKKYHASRSANSNRFYIFECILLILLWGLRFRVGGDSIRYEEYFDGYPLLGDVEKFDFTYTTFQPLWVYYNSLLKSICNDFVFFQIMNAIIVNGATFYFIDKYCKNRFFVVVLFYILWNPYFNTEILRESYSVIIFMFAYNYIYQKKYLKYFTCVLFAYFWHVSAVFLAIIPALVLILQQTKGYKPIFFAILFTLLISSVLKFIYENSAFGILSMKYMDRLEGNITSEGLNLFGIMAKIISLFPAFLLIYYHEKKYQEKSGQLNFNRITILLYMIIELVSINFLPLERLRNYFIIFFLIIFSETFLANKHTKYSYLFYIGLFVLLSFRISFYTRDYKDRCGGMEANYYDLYMPYHSIFNPIKEPIRERISIYQFDN